MIKLIGLLKRKQGITIEEFARYWAEEHTRNVGHLVPPEIDSLAKGYIQNYAVTLPGGGEPWFDAAVEIWYDSIEDWQKWNKWYLGEEGKPLRDDEENFMDRTKGRFLIVREGVKKGIAL